MRFEIHDLEQAVRAIRAAFPSITEDEELFADTLEGETNLHEIIGKLVDQSREQKANGVAVACMIDALSAREEAWKSREAATRALILKIMNMASQRKIVLPQATVSIANGRAAIIVTDESQLPEDCFVVEKKVSKTKIKAMIDRGETVPGAVISNGNETLTIR